MDNTFGQSFATGIEQQQTPNEDTESAKKTNDG